MREPYLAPTPADDEDWHGDDTALARFLSWRLTPAALAPRLDALGREAPRLIDGWARQADRELPRLEEDGFVRYDKAYLHLREAARDHRVFTYAWHGGTRLATFALGYLYAQAESGYYCPACMTDAAAFVLSRHAPHLAADLVPALTQDIADGAFEGGMFLTEKTGGSDVGATDTTAVRADDGTWRLTGNKWFASNVDAQVVLTLARMSPQAEAPGTRGLGLFWLPARLENGRANPGLRRVSLKDKLGVRSMATGEVELDSAHARLVTAAPHGFKVMAEMVNLSRLYNAVASVAIARRAFREVSKNATHRQAFGKPLIEHALYRKLVSELESDVRGALYFTLDTAATFDAAFPPHAGATAKTPAHDQGGDEDEMASAVRLLRALTPMAKATTARLSVSVASQACEALGGNGYVEDWVTPRLLRDAQVLPIWEGTTNIQALDLLRAIHKDQAHVALADHSRAMLGADAALRAHWDAWQAEAAQADETSCLRILEMGYHLRVATLLEVDAARDGDELATGHAVAYLVRHIERDVRRWEDLVRPS